MNTLRTLTVVLLAVICRTALAGPDSLIAYYPLTATPNDTTGHLGPMQLTNAPFREGSLYCNGVYFGDSACWATTPLLPPSIFQAFTVSVKFKVDSLPFNNVWDEAPVLMGGVACRWMGGMVRSDSTVAIRYNNSYTQPSSLHYSLHTWHEMMFSYDTSRALGCLYLDSTFACSVVFAMDHGSVYDATFGVNDCSRGTTFRGSLKDLKIFSVILNPTSVGDNPNGTPETFQLLQNYPNPFNPTTVISYRLPIVSNVRLVVYDLLGREVSVLVNERKSSGSHEVKFDGSGLASGIYFYRFQAGDFLQTKRLVVLK